MSYSSDGTARTATVRLDLPPDERRKSERYKLRDARGTMSWDEGSERVACDVELLNISGGGAALLAPQAPAPGTLVRLLLGCKPAAMGPVEAHALAATRDPSGKMSVRLQFTQWVSLDAILEHHRERRLWQRFPARENRAKLTWFENGSEKTFRGELLNISGGGAAIIMDVIVPAHEPIWFELEVEGKDLDPIESRLIVISLDPSGSTIARIKFIDACPIVLFELAIHGSRGMQWVGGKSD